MKTKVCVEAPATIANFGPGFDTFGLCIDAPSDVVEMKVTSGSGFEIELAKDCFEVPTDPDSNTASVAAKAMFKLCSPTLLKEKKVKMRLFKGIRPGSGLGSSAASAVAGALAAAAILDVNDGKKILAAASEGEAVSSGAAHLDNVTPCLFGGFTVIVDPSNYEILRIHPSHELKIVICLPDIVVETAKARKMIPKELSVQATVSHVGWAAGMIHGMKTGDIELIALCMRDEISVPARKKLIKGFSKVEAAAKKAGALSFSIGGSGPSVFALAHDSHEEIGKAMVKAFKEVDVESKSFIARPGTGAKVVQSE